MHGTLVSYTLKNWNCAAIVYSINGICTSARRVCRYNFTHDFACAHRTHTDDGGDDGFKQILHKKSLTKQTAFLAKVHCIYSVGGQGGKWNILFIAHDHVQIQIEQMFVFPVPKPDSLRYLPSYNSHQLIERCTSCCIVSSHAFVICICIILIGGYKQLSSFARKWQTASNVCGNFA